jgi:hypothetical protein
MKGVELHQLIRKTGIKGTQLAKIMGFQTASRVYKAAALGNQDVQTVFDLAFEKILGKSRFNSMLTELRTKESKAQVRAIENKARWKKEKSIEDATKAEKKRERAVRRALQKEKDEEVFKNFSIRDPASVKRLFESRFTLKIK